MERQEISEQAALYALDGLVEAEGAWIETELASPTAWADELASFQTTVAALAYSAPAVPMAADLKERLLQRIAAEPLPSPVPPLTPTVIEDLRQKAEAIQWRPYDLAPQTKIGTLLQDPDTREVQCFVRAVGAVQFPNHRHAQPEEIIVLEGDLEINGQVYGQGDRVCSQAGTEHRPVTHNGCLLFLRASLDDEILSF
ncbi:MAG: cupin domain-containing protein [Leptolyngbya sp. IPPAS B-1204]|nr:cupin domain-containing protein [Elainella sp. C42_A2020_010]RNJ67330.1 MAG: hypothetical protein EDM05_21385 [Leptolyngbya sp. IPPAS B-1204]